MPYDIKDFPASADLERIAFEDTYFKLLNSDTYDYAGLTDKGVFRLKEFFSNDKDKAAILAKALNIAPLIVHAGSDFLLGEPFRVQIDTETPNEDTQKKIDEIIERNGLQNRADESSQLFQAIGHAHFKLFSRDNKAVIEEVPYSYWFPNWSGVSNGSDTKNVRIVVFLTQVDSGGVEKKYVYVEDYFMEDGTAVIEYALFTEKAGGKIGDPVSFDEFPDLKPKGAQVVTYQDGETAKETLRYKQKTKLDRLPLVSVNLRKTVLSRYGESLYKPIMPLLEEINDRLTQVSIQFLKHLNAKLQIPDGAVALDPKTGKLQNSDMEVILAKEGEPDAKYITNDNPLIEDAFEHLDRCIRQCAKLTQTPDSFLLEDEKGGVEKAESLRTRMMLFLKRIRRYERKYDEALKQIIRTALKIEGVQDVDSIPLKIIFDNGLPKDWENDMSVWGGALSQGLASRETAVSRFQGLEGDELEEEIARIDKEEEEAMKARVNELLAVDPHPEE